MTQSESDPPGDVVVREARQDDLLAIARVLEGALLETDVPELRERLDPDGDGVVLVAESVDGGNSHGDGHVVGALVLVADHVEAIAVRRRHRRQRIGSRLIAAADARAASSLTAEFRADVRAFYEGLGFDVTPIDGDDDQFRGRLDG